MRGLERLGLEQQLAAAPSLWQQALDEFKRIEAFLQAHLASNAP
jgi:hypothetical protein